MILPGSAPVDKDMQSQIFQAQVVQALNAIGSQLDLLIQLECGYLPRKKMKDWFVQVNAPKDEDKAVVAEANVGGDPVAEGVDTRPEVEFVDGFEASLLDDQMRAKIEAAAQEFEGADRMEEQMALDLGLDRPRLDVI